MPTDLNFRPGDVVHLRHPVLSTRTEACALCLRSYEMAGRSFTLLMFDDQGVHGLTFDDLMELDARLLKHLAEFEHYEWANLARLWSDGDRGVFNALVEDDQTN